MTVVIFFIFRLAHYLANGKVRSIKYTKSLSEHQIPANNGQSKIVPRKDKNGQLIIEI